MDSEIMPSAMTTGPRTTADSEKEGRLIVSAGNMKKKKRQVLNNLIKSK